MTCASANGVQRLAIVVLGVVVGCGVPARPIDVTTTPTNSTERMMSAEQFAAATSRLRATLARNHIAMETQTVVETCRGNDLHGKCVRCDVAGVGDTAGVEPDMIDAISLAFAAYPDRALAAMELDHVALCSKIRYSDDDGKTPAGVAVLGEARILLSIEAFHGDRQYDSFTIGQVVHHELFHVLDESIGAAGDREWAALNPKGFAYRDPAEPQERPRGFVNGYATTDDDEDRASTFEYLMGQPQKLCELAKTDKVLAAKTRVVWKRAARIVGDAVLRRTAHCVEILMKADSRTPSRVRTRSRFRTAH